MKTISLHKHRCAGDPTGAADFLEGGCPQPPRRRAIHKRRARTPALQNSDYPRIRNRCRTAARSKHGIALIEILTVLIILVAFLLVSSKLFAITMREIREAPAAANRVASMEQVRAMMSRDLWNARELHQTDADTMMLIDSHGTLITWHKSADGSLLRDTTDSHATWNDLQFTFKYESGAVVLTQQKRTWTLPAPLMIEVKP